MATPKLITDATSEFEESVINRAIMSDGTKIQVKRYHARLSHSAGNIVVNSANDSAGIVTGNVVHNVGNSRTEITIAGFTNPPVVLALPVASDTAYWVKAIAISNVMVHVFYYHSTTLARITGAAAADMDFNLWISGF